MTSSSNLTLWTDTHYFPGASVIRMCHVIGRRKPAIIELSLSVEDNGSMSHVKAVYQHLMHLLTTEIPEKSKVSFHMTNKIVFMQLTEKCGSDDTIRPLIDKVQHIIKSKELVVGFKLNRSNSNKALKHYKATTFKPPRKKKPKPVKIKKEDKLAWVKEL